MLFFRKKKNEETTNLVDALTKRPDEILVTDTYMAVYSSDIDKVIFITGDYRKLDQEEVNRVLVERYQAAMASRN